MLDRWRLKRLERAYRKIALLETKIHDVGEAWALRNAHSWDTLNRVDSVFKGRGIPRSERRRFKRALVAGTSSRSRHVARPASS